MTTAKPPRRKPGRPAFEPTARERAQVRKLAGLGLSDLEVAAVIGVHVDTLRKYLAGELALGLITAKVSVSMALFKAATHRTKPSVRAQIHWLAVRAGWRPQLGEPTAPKPPELGKKDAANLAAKTAHLGSDWEDLLGPDDQDTPLQ